MQVYSAAASQVNGRTSYALTHDLSEKYNRVNLAQVGGPVVTIVGSTSGEDGVNAKHVCRTPSGYYLNLLTGQSGAVYRYATPIRVAHGVMMGTAFALLFPIGLLFARYGKAEGGFWFKVHFFCQIYASIIGLVGIIIGYSMPEVQFQTRFHAQLGTVIFIITFIQVVMGLLRPDHTPKGETPKPQRRVFEFAHHWLGRIICLAAVAQIAEGIMELGTAPWSYAIWIPFPALFFIMAIILEIRLCFNPAGPKGINLVL